MSMSPSAVQLLSSHINAVYFGATAGPNLAIPLSSDDAPILEIAIGGSSLGLAIASIASSHGAIPIIGTGVGALSLATNLDKITTSAVNTGVIYDDDIKRAAADITGILGTISLGLAGAAVGGTVGVAVVAVIGALSVATSIALIIDAQAAGNDPNNVPEIKAMADAAKQFLNDSSEAAKIVTDVMTDPVFWDAFAAKGEEIFAPLFDPLNAMGHWIGQKAYDLNPQLAVQFTAAVAALAPRRVDPLVLDLDNDGLETTGLNATNPIYFDQNADGVKTATGWVSAHDAFLVLDKNANGTIDNGRELFGDSTLKSNGQMATDGFDALRDLDANADGKINAGDAQFANLRLWRDLNQDGVSQANELFTLGSQNIAAINVGSTAHSQILANGNQLADLGSYVKTDGSVATLGEVTGNLGDINLVQDTFLSKFTDTLDTSAVATLPDMQGAGQVRSLREAASQSATLAQRLTDFAAATTRAAQQALIDPILKAWRIVGCAEQSEAHRSRLMRLLPSAHPIWLLERFNGRTFNTVPAGTAANDKTWRIAA